uniref:Centrosomal protein of 162 kDa n=1 Tax=Albugo laibachii Nc14 TaxID=890382 RepID=F0VZE1_9STRA|nr:conserved hypothetical protein [Albugo laibachii Nc14]|eukprot:CCA14171.1 conserved hypothetical protein [Albugo laibachii Nc14]
MQLVSVQPFASRARNKHNKAEKATRITLEERVAEILKQSRQKKDRIDGRELLMTDEDEENESMTSPDKSFEMNYTELDSCTGQRPAEILRASMSSINSDAFVLNQIALTGTEQVDSRYQQLASAKVDDTLTEFEAHNKSGDSWPDYSEDEDFVSKFDQMKDYMLLDAAENREPSHLELSMKTMRAVDHDVQPEEALKKAEYEDDEFEARLRLMKLLNFDSEYNSDEKGGSNVQQLHQRPPEDDVNVADSTVGNREEEIFLSGKQSKKESPANSVVKKFSPNLIDSMSFDGQIENMDQVIKPLAPTIVEYSSSSQPPPPAPPLEDDSDIEMLASSKLIQDSRNGGAPKYDTFESPSVNSADASTFSPKVDTHHPNTSIHDHHQVHLMNSFGDSPFVVINETKSPEAKAFKSSQQHRHDMHTKWTQDSEKHEEKRLVKEQELAFFLKQAQKQIMGLEQQLRQKEEANNAKHVRSSAVDFIHDKAIQPDNVTRLENEVQSQEHLIQAFQRENEQLMQKMKQIQKGTSYDVHLENKRLKAESQHTIQHDDKPVGIPTESVPMHQYHAAVEARLRAESQAAGLQEEIINLKQVHRERELEWKSRVNQIEKAMRQVESKYEGIDLDQVVQEHVQVRQLEKELELQQKQASHTAKSLQKKLEWYIVNQRLLEDQEQEVDQLKSRIRELESCAINQKEAKFPTNLKEVARDQGETRLRSRSDLHRIQKLENLVKELQSALEKRHPHSVGSLLVAFRQAEMTQSEQVASEYQKKIERISMEIEALRTKYECKVQSFRQQHEKLKLHYEQKLADALRSGSTSTQHSKKIRTRGVRGNNQKPCPDQAEQIARLREFYTAKVRDVNHKWAARLDSLLASKSKPSICDSCQASKNTQQNIQDLNQAVQNKDERLDESDAQTRATIEEEKEKVRMLTDQLKQSEMTRQQLAQTFESFQALRLPIEPKQSDVEKAARGTQTQNHLVELERYQMLEEKLTWQEEEQNSLEERHAAKCEKLQTEIHRIHKENRKLLEAHAMQVKTLENDLMKAQVEKHEMYPELRLMESLAEKVDTLARKYQLRQTELDLIVSRAKSIRELEIAEVQRKYTLVLAEKNAEIQSFELKLEEMIQEMEKLRNG